MKNKYIEDAVKKTLTEDVISKGAKANGIYVQGDRLDTFTAGLVTGVYAMARTLGMDEGDIQKIIDNQWGKSE